MCSRRQAIPSGGVPPVSCPAVVISPKYNPYHSTASIAAPRWVGVGHIASKHLYWHLFHATALTEAHRQASPYMSCHKKKWHVIYGTVWRYALLLGRLSKLVGRLRTSKSHLTILRIWTVGRHLVESIHARPIRKVQSYPPCPPSGG